MPQTIIAKLANGQIITDKEERIVIRMMAEQLMDKFEKPGKEKATYHWCAKFVSKYPQCAAEGINMNQKTVLFIT